MVNQYNIQTPDLSGIYNAYTKARDDEENRAMKKQAFDAQMQNQGIAQDTAKEGLTQQRIKTMNARDQSRLNSLVTGSIELKPYLDQGDIAGAQQFLNRRKQDLDARQAAGEDIHSQDTTQALELLQSNPDQLKKMIDYNVSIGDKLGVTKRDNALYKPSALQIADAIEQAKLQGNTDRVNLLNQTARLVDRGQGIDSEGNVINRGGYTDALGEKKRAEGRGAAIGKAGGATEAKLPDIVLATEKGIAQIDAVLSHPNLRSNVGSLDSRLPNITSGAQDFQSKFNQLDAQNYVNGIQSFVGLGSLSNAEGEAAKNAAGHMIQATNEQDFINAGRELQYYMRKGLEAARQKVQIGRGADAFSDQTYQPQQLGQNQGQVQPQQSGIKFLGFE